MAVTTTNPLGARMLVRYAAGTADRAQLDAAYKAGWISDADYAAATTPPPEPNPEPTPDPAPDGDTTA